MPEHQKINMANEWHLFSITDQSYQTHLCFREVCCCCNPCSNLPHSTLIRLYLNKRTKKSVFLCLESAPIHELLHFIVQNQNGSTPSTPKHVWNRPTVKWSHPLCSIDRPPALQGASVHGSFQAWLHHHSPSNCVQWIRQQPCRCCHCLCCRPSFP